MIGQQISHYSILEKLGEGGMGEVYLAEDLDLKRSVALKILPADFASDPERLARFRREAESLAAINHPNIVTIFSIEQVEDLHILTMERVEGRTLDELLPAGGLPVDRLLDIAVSLSGALAAAHEKGITHRDLKPANLMLTDDGRLKVLDFGLAKLRRPEQSQVSATGGDLLVTAEHAILGTVPYMSPEQFEGGDVDGRSDLFCLGIVLYELATGQRPFQGKSLPAVMSAILKETPPPIRQLRKELPAGLEAILERCLRKDPAERYSTAGEVRSELLALRAGASVGANRLSASGSRAKVVAVTGVLALLVGLVLWRSLFMGGAGGALGIVVLPFDNGGEADHAYFAAEMTHGVAQRLSSVEGLVVRRPPAIWKERTPEEIGAALDVDYVLHARVFLVEKDDERRVLVTPELSSTSDGALLPVLSCNRAIPDNDDILDVQRLIANLIVERIGGRLGAVATPGAAPTQSKEAYTLYLQGRYFYGKRDEESLQKALECYQEAVRLDEDFTLALVGIASIPGARSWYSLVDPKESSGQAMDMIERALAVDPELPEAWTHLASDYQWKLDFEEAERAWKKAIEFGKKHRGGWPSAHQWYSYTLAWTGRLEEALEQVLIAYRLDPVSPIITTWVGLAHYYLGEYDAALAWMDKALGLDPDFVPAHWHRTWVCGVAGKHDEAIANAERARTLNPTNPIYTVNLAWALAGAGRDAEARELLAQVAEIAPTRYVSNYHLAAVHVALGEYDAAFQCLDKSLDDMAEWRAALNVDQRFGPLRDDPRFAGLLARLGL